MTTKRKEVDKEAEEENNPTVETTAEKIRKGRLMYGHNYRYNNCNIYISYIG